MIVKYPYNIYLGFVLTVITLVFIGVALCSPSAHEMRTQIREMRREANP